MEVDKLFSTYQTENGDLIEYILHAIDEKQKAGDWDFCIDSKSDKLLSVLMYEYVSSIEKLTDGKFKAKQVIDKLSNQMEKFRIGDFKAGEDDNITYDGKAVTSEAYKKQCRIDKNFGAHAIEYKDDEENSKTAVVLFDNKQVATINGQQYTLSGIDLQDLSDIRHTVFHEWTHIMEKCMIKTSQLSREDIVFEDGESIYINAMLSPDLSKQEYKDFISNVDDLLEGDAEVPFEGISTIELNDRKCPDNRIMHNQISEGATEFIARKVMEIIGEKVKHPDRYAKQVKIVGDIFEANGLAESLNTYFTQPHRIIRALENKRVKSKDMLHYISDYINKPNILKIFSRINIDMDGSVKEGLISRQINRFKRIIFKKDALLLAERDSHSTAYQRKEEKDTFRESLIVSPEESTKKIEKQNEENVQTKDDEKSGPSLDD
ncbi:MAG: hypothetical protein IKE01_01630 [Clostridia bacterium]|nr:hypothetical protein [Clostridia bacterium]